MADFYTILTSVGQGKLANGQVTGVPVVFAEMAVGDGLNGAYYNPNAEQLVLKNEVWRGGINQIYQHPDNPNWIVVEVVIPTGAGPFYVREVGIFDAAGDMIAIGKYPETYKPVLGAGAAKDLNIRMVLEVSNTALVTLKIDPAIILSTRAYVDSALIEAGEGLPVTVIVETTLTGNHGTVYLVPAADATVRYHLPVYESVSARKRYRLKNIGQGIAEVDGTDNKTIDGDAVLQLMPGDRTNVAKDGVNWQTI